MDRVTLPLARTIGGRVKQERKAKGWTLDLLANTAGVSRRMVVNVEHGTVNPSVGILLRISDALGIGLPSLVQPPTPAETKVTRRGDGATLWAGARGGSGVLVTGTRKPDVLELWDWRLAPGERRESEAHSSGTRELLHVLAGKVRMTVGDDVHLLLEGDALSFAGDAAHSYENPGGTPARFLLAVFEPGVGRTGGA